MRASRRLVPIGLACLLLLVAGGLGSAQTDPAAQGIVVEPDPDGDVTLRTTTTYDLDDEDEATAFETLDDDDELQSELVDSYETQLQAVADDLTARTGQEVTVSDVTMDLETSDSVGVLTTSATFRGLPIRHDGRLVVSEPFDSEFAVDREVRVVAPPGYEVVSVSPEGTVEDGVATWDEDANLDGFEVALAPEDDADESVPGLGVVPLLAVLVLLGLVMGHRTTQ